MQQYGYWPLPDDLVKLHDEIIGYGLEVHRAADIKFAQEHRFPVSYGALFTLHWNAIVIHRSIRTLCEAGWTPSTPILIRTLLEIIASCYAIVVNHENAEYMSFKFIGSYLIQSVKDADTSEALRSENRKQLDGLRGQLQGKDAERADELVKNYKPQSYWYSPEFRGPGEILKQAKNDLQFMYRQFSGSSHGGFLSALLFDDSPDMAKINPEEHPRRRRSAVVASSRLLLDISFLRGQFEGVATVEAYKAIVKDLILPQKERI